MAQTLSTLVANTVAGITVQNPTGSMDSPLTDTVTVPDTTAADTVILAPLPVNAILTEVDLDVGDLGSAGTIDVGLFRLTIINDLPVFIAVDKDCIADNLDVSVSNSMALAPTRMAALLEDTANKRVYEIAGLPALPAYPLLYIGLTTDTGTTVAGAATVTAHFKE